MRNYFPALNKYKNIIFCENAGGSQIPQQVLNSLYNFVTNNYVQPYANNILSEKITKNIQNIKNITNTIFNNKSGTIVYASSCTQNVYNFANSIDNYLNNTNINTSKNNYANIILSDFSHESCTTPFERIAKKNNIDIKWWSLICDKKTNNDDSIKKYIIDYDSLINKVNNNTKLVVLPHVSNILGNEIDVKYLTKQIKSKNKNTRIFVDGVAYMPHGLIDVHDYNVDYYVVSFYKFCGFRISALYIKDTNELNEIENQNHYIFDNIKDNNTNHKKLELGGINFETASSIIGLSDYLIDYAKQNNYTGQTKYFNRDILKFAMDKIRMHEKNLTDRMLIQLENNNEINILQCNNSIHNKFPIFSIIFKNYDENNVNLILNELGLICNSSQFYCNRLFKQLNMENKSVLRISLMHYNTLEEVDIIVKYLNMFKKINSQFYYTIDYSVKNTISKYLKDSFNYLEEDKYYNSKRNRAYSLLNVEDNKIKIVGNLKFYQSSNLNNYNGNVYRDYKNIQYNLINDKSFKDLVLKFVEYSSEYLNTQQHYIQVHQIRVYVNNSTNINVVPEGIHQDGYNIIGMCCINRENINGGISKIYDNNKNIVYQHQLQSGEFLIVNDNIMYHDVSLISLDDIRKIGYRDIFVFTTIG